MIASVVVIIDILFAGVFGFFVLYLFMLSLLALTVRPRRTFTTKEIRRFAFVVPAHNEENSISKTINSLKSVDYPKDLFDVIVIADNCSDRTAEVAGTLGAIVYERTDAARRGKGYALRWCFDRLLLLAAPYHAIVVVDADTIVDPDFLSVVNYYCECGSVAIQCSDLVMPQPESWSSEMTRFGFTLYNYARPAGRRALKCSAGIRGNGMCFSTETLRKVPWSTYSLNEDLEYGLVLLLNGINVDFAPEAKVYATMPSNPRNAESQRSRWERGRFPIIRAYAGRLLGATFTSPAYRPFDAFVDLITPPFVNLFAVVLGFFLVHLLVLLIGFQAVAPLVIVWGLLIIAGLGHVFIGLYAARADALLYKAFFNIPRYALWKLLLYAKAIRRPATQEWVRTTRDPSVEHHGTKGE